MWNTDNEVDIVRHHHSTVLASPLTLCHDIKGLSISTSYALWGTAVMA